MSNKRHNTMDELLGLNELKTLPLYKAIMAECLGTMILVFVGCGAGIGNNTLFAALTFGITLAAMISALGHVSGSHINPAVSIGFLVCRYISVTKFLLFSVAQIVGSMAGIGFLSLMVTDTDVEMLGVVNMVSGITAGQALGMEVILTFVLLLTILAVCDERRTDLKGTTTLIVGLVVTALILSGSSTSGAGLNPARCLGPVIIAGGEAWNHHWVYLVGPLLGASLAGVCYSYVFRQAKTESSLTITTQKIIDNQRY